MPQDRTPQGRPHLPQGTEREHFRAYVRGLIARSLRAQLLSRRDLNANPAQALLDLARAFYDDLVRDAEWVAREVGRELAEAGVVAAAQAGRQVLTASLAGASSPTSRVAARVAVGLFDGLENVLKDLIARSR